MTASLIIPRVEVYWGDTNLTCYNPQGSSQNKYAEGLTSLVYNVKVSMEDQGQTPTGSMDWNPSGAGFNVYLQMLQSKLEETITVRYYYNGGNSISFEFMWGGQVENYGKEMGVTVKLVSLLDGLINANYFATTQNDKEEKGKSHKEAISTAEKQYGINGLNIIRYTKKASEDTSKAKVMSAYNDGGTFMDSMQSIAKDNGNFVFFNNVDKAHAVVYTPYTYDNEEVVFKPGPGAVNTLKRYGYFVGPGIIQTLTKTSEWQPPQKSQELAMAATFRKAEEKQAKKQQKADARAAKAASAAAARAAKGLPPKPVKQQQATAGSSPSGVYGAKTSPNVKSENNEVGPKKQDMFTAEKGAKLAMTTLMCPSLTGIKPLDLVFVPNFAGTYMEDWIVTSVEYQQTEGGVDVAIQATRTYGLGDFMRKDVGQKWMTIANNLGLVGENSSLEQWSYYAWTMYLKGVQTPSFNVRPLE